MRRRVQIKVWPTRATVSVIVWCLLGVLLTGIQPFLKRAAQIYRSFGALWELVNASLVPSHWDVSCKALNDSRAGAEQLSITDCADGERSDNGERQTE
jgi:hypothetical protein